MTDENVTSENLEPTEESTPEEATPEEQGGGEDLNVNVGEDVTPGEAIS